MNAESWERINGLLLEILPLTREQRAAVLNQCGDEGHDLRADVEPLLQADDANSRDGFLGAACSAALGSFLDVNKWNGRAGEVSGRLVGRYQLHGLIGEGGTSEVYRASLMPEEGQVSNGAMAQRVAFKLILRHMATGEALSRFQTEQKTLASIDHPCVASYCDSGLTDDGLPYLVMELIEGQRIDRYCDEKQLSVRDRVMLLLQVVEAVEFVHQRGVLHRDLTPPNILVTSEGVPKLVDFGIARSITLSLDTLTSSSQTATGAILGTPEYLSPEQAMGRSQHADIRTDVYILGVLLYRLLTGRTPFQGVSLASLLDAIRHSDPVPPSRLNSGIPRSLETICLKCLQKAPSRRYDSAQELADDMRRWLDGRPIKARPVSSLERTWRWCRRRPVVAGLSSVLALILSVGFLAIVLLWRHAEKQRLSAYTERISAERERSQADESRRLAEADFDVASKALAKLHELGFGGYSSISGTVSSDAKITLMAEISRYLLDLLARRPDHPLIHEQLKNVENQLSLTLMDKRRWDEARSVLEESLATLRRDISGEPAVRRAVFWEGHNLHRLAEVTSQQGKIQESVAYVRRAVAAGEELVRLTPSAESFNQLAAYRESLASALIRDGNLAEASSLIAANRSMIDSVPEGCLDYRIVAWQLFTRLDLDNWDADSRPNPTSILLASQSVHSGPFVRPTSPEAETMLPETWAGRVVQSLRKILGSNTEKIDEAMSGWAFGTRLAGVSMNQRHARQLESARRTSDRFLAFGRLIVARNLKSEYAHLALANAYSEVYKNACQTGDRAAIEQNLRLAIEANQRALDLSPRNEIVRRGLDQRKGRLQALLNPPGGK